jgi:hypothetical protein
LEESSCPASYGERHQVRALAGLTVDAARNDVGRFVLAPKP